VDVGIADDEDAVAAGGCLVRGWFGGASKPTPNTSEGGELFTALPETIPLSGGARGGSQDGGTE